jgi:acetyl-CoA C-acetyltransferase
MTATIEQTLKFNELGADDLDYVELYSCFPCIPKMARRLLNWSLERPTSVYGGLTFGGAPVGDCMMHAAASMVEKMRADGRSGCGFIFANGGYATHNHAIVLRRTAGPHADTPQTYDVHDAAEAIRGPSVSFLERYAGPGTIESYVMPFGRDGVPSLAAVVARTANGERFLAHVPKDDHETLHFLTAADGEPIGARGAAVIMEDGRSRWVR